MLSLKWIKYAKDLSQKHRSYRKFYHAMSTDSTISTYAYSLKKFMNYLVSIKEITHNEEYKKLIEYNSEKITDLLEDYVIELSQKLKPNGINTHLSAVELFLEMNRKIWR